MIGFDEITLFAHDLHLTEAANALQVGLDHVTAKLNSFDLANLDAAVSSRASQASVDTVSSSVGEIRTLLTTFNLTNLDTTVSSRASQTSVDALSSSVGDIQNLLATFDLTNLDTTISSRASQVSVDSLSSSVGSIQTGVGELNSRMEAVEQSLSIIEAGLYSCQVSIVLVPQGEGHNGSKLEFYLHTTLASERVRGKGAKGIIVTGAKKGQDVGIRSIEGVIKLEPARVMKGKVPNVQDGGSRSTNLTRLAKEAKKARLVGVIGTEALVALVQIGVKPDHVHGVREAAVEAAYCGLPFLVVCSDDKVSILVQRLEEENLDYSIVDLRKDVS